MSPADASHQSVNQGIHGNRIFTEVTEDTGGVAAGVSPPSQDKELVLRQLLERDPPLNEYIRELFSHSKAVLAATFALEWFGEASTILPFTRWVKAYRTMVGVDGPQGWKRVSQVVGGWGETPDHWWDKFYFVSEEDAEVEFLWWWDRMRSLPNANPLEYALRLADAKPLGLRKAVTRERSKKYPRFISLCGYLQSTVGPRTPIALPVENIAELLDVRPMSVCRYRLWATEDEYLTKVKAHSHRPNGGGQAAEYLFDLTLFPKAFHNREPDE